MAVLVEPDVLPAGAVSMIETGMRALETHAPGGTVKAWYHDMPVWLYIGPGYPSTWVVLQASVLMSQGELVIEISSRTEIVIEGQLIFPNELRHVKELALANLSVEDFVKTVITTFDAEVDDPLVPGHGDDDLEPGFRRVPLTSDLKN